MTSLLDTLCTAFLLDTLRTAGIMDLHMGAMLGRHIFAYQLRPDRFCTLSYLCQWGLLTEDAVHACAAAGIIRRKAAADGQQDSGSHYGQLFRRASGLGQGRL